MKTRKRGSGITAYTVGEPETREELLDGLHKLHGLDVALVNEAQQWRDLLAKAGFDGNLVSQRAAIRDEHGEQSLADLVADYVIHAEVMQAQRAEVEAGGGNAGTLIMAAAWCGQLRERIFWKYGIDEKTGARIEALALHGRSFSGKTTDAAKKARTKKGKKHEQHVIDLAQRLLNEGGYRRANGEINRSALAKGCEGASRVGGGKIGYESARKIISAAITQGNLV